MNAIDFVLINMIEELSETQKEAAKCLRFTPEHEHAGMSNRERMLLEYSQVAALDVILCELGFDLTIKYQHVLEKLDRLAETVTWSYELGTIESNVVIEVLNAIARARGRAQKNQEICGGS